MGTLTTALMSVTRAKRAERGLMISFFLQGFMALSYIARIPDLIAQIHVSLVQWGLISGLTGFGGIIPLLFANKLIARFGTRPVMRVTFVGVAASLACYGLANNGIVFLIAALTFSFLNSIFNLALNSQAILFQDRVGSIVLGKMHAVWSIGATLTTLAAGLLAPVIPFHWYVVGIGAVCALAFLLTSGLILAPHEDGHNDEKKRDTGRISLKLPGRVWVLTAGLFGSIFAEITMMDWSAVFAKRELLQGVATVGLPYTAFSMAMIVGRLSVSRLTRITPMANIGRWAGWIGSIAMGIGVFGGGMIAKSNPTAGLVVSMVFLAIAGLGAGPMVPNFFGATSKIDGMATALVMARISLVNSFVFMGAKFLMGSIAQSVSVMAAFAFPVITFFAAGIVSSSMLRWKQQGEVKGETTDEILEDSYPATSPIAVVRESDRP